MILDSGDRRTFDTGAVRDIQEGKGRCDLLPLEVVARFMCDDEMYDRVLYYINAFRETDDSIHLYEALDHFCDKAYGGSRSLMILDVSKHFEEGNKKYPPCEDGTPNWQLGIPINCYIDSAVRHYLKFLRGDKDERHDLAFIWNVMCCAWEHDYHKEGER